jgi:hypothetical protein
MDLSVAASASAYVDLQQDFRSRQATGAAQDEPYRDWGV